MTLTATLFLLALATLITEDGACVAAGLLIEQQHIPAIAGVLACAAGIYLGDMLLWALGRWAGDELRKWKWVQNRIGIERLNRLSKEFEKRSAAMIFAARFVPGTRLPLYLAAGALRHSAWKFSVLTLLAVAIWSPVIVLGSAAVGQLGITPLRHLLTNSVVTLIVAMLLILSLIKLIEQLSSARSRAALFVKFSKIWRWEFWPSWLFYLPLIPWIAWLSLRHRSFMVITLANPGFELGGFVNESKSDILRRIPGNRVADFAVIAPPENACEKIEHRCMHLQKLLDERRWNWPLIFKPDIGQRGRGVRLIHNHEQAREYLSLIHEPVIVQQYHPGPYEAGLFYVRDPHQSQGTIFSITDKQFSFLIGDGKNTIEQLIWQHPRYRMQAATFMARHRAQLHVVPAKNEKFQLALAGNHCQGTLFCDGSHLITPELSNAIDAVASKIEGFYFGRFDLRYENVQAFRAGRDWCIIELNGVTSESTNLYDPAHSLLQAYRILFRQWTLLFAIGTANRKLGHSTRNLRELLAQVRVHFENQSVTPLAD